MAAAKRILIAADASDATRQAVDYVSEMISGRPEFQVGLLHLELPPQKLAEWGGSENPVIEASVSAEREKIYNEMENEVTKKGRALLTRLHDSLTKKGVNVTASQIRFEDPLDPKHIARDALKSAKEGDYGTIVVGRHSFSGLKQFFQHHVAEELIRTAQAVTVWVVE